VVLGALLSSLALSTVALSHETSPSVADFETKDGIMSLTILATVEAMLADVDLSVTANTDDSENAAQYDALRALPPEQIEPILQSAWPKIESNISVIVDGQNQPIEYLEATIPEVGDIELSRPSELVLSVELPKGASAVQIGWVKQYGTLIVRQNGVEQSYTGFLSAGEITDPISLSGGGGKSGWDAFWSYIPTGFDHIIPKGLDHILFVLGLFFFSIHLRPLLVQVTAFTLAHTVTLALGALGLVTIPASVVEPLIAASIVFVAVENIFARKLNPWRTFIIFGFGLLHGLGFASVLAEFGMPSNGFIPALVGFNVGVELGQLAVIAIAFFAVGLWFRNKTWYRPVVAVPASVAIAIVGAGWFVERVFNQTLMPL